MEGITSFVRRDLLVACELALEALPEPAMWAAAVALRTDGSRPDGVFGVVDEVRTHLLALLGDLARGVPVQRRWIEGWSSWANASREDRLAAYVLIVEQLGEAAYWRPNLERRRDGTDVDAVLGAVEVLRVELQSAAAHFGGGRASSAMAN